MAGGDDVGWGLREVTESEARSVEYERRLRALEGAAIDLALGQMRLANAIAFMLGSTRAASGETEALRRAHSNMDQAYNLASEVANLLLVEDDSVSG